MWATGKFADCLKIGQVGLAGSRASRAAQRQTAICAVQGSSPNFDPFPSFCSDGLVLIRGPTVSGFSSKPFQEFRATSSRRKLEMKIATRALKRGLKMATRGCAEGPGPPGSCPPCRTGNKHLVRRDDISTIVAFRRVLPPPASRHVAVARRTDEQKTREMCSAGWGAVGWGGGGGGVGVWVAEGHLRCDGRHGGVTRARHDGHLARPPAVFMLPRPEASI